jgi:glycosyltransferase involved in cell wall biosynthesis
LNFEKKNSEALARAILTLKRDQTLYRQTSLGAKRIFQEKFTLDLMGEKTYALYEEVIMKRLWGGGGVDRQ